MSQIVKDGAQDASEKQKMSLQGAVCKPHGKKTQKSSSQTVEQAHNLTKEEGGEQDSDEKYGQGIFSGIIAQDNESYDICKSQLDAGYRHKRRYGALYGKDC